MLGMYVKNRQQEYSTILGGWRETAKRCVHLKLHVWVLQYPHVIRTCGQTMAGSRCGSCGSC